MLPEISSKHSSQTKPSTKTLKQARKHLRGVIREDSDDELGDEDIPWEWIRTTNIQETTDRGELGIIGARLGDKFDVQIGDCVLIKGEGLKGEAYVGMACEFIENHGQMMVNVNWFSTESEITKKSKKRMDFLVNELYLNPSYDEVPLPSINGRAKVYSKQKYDDLYPKGVPKKSREYGKVFICRRGCNPRTATYTEEFNWDCLYQGRNTNIFKLGEFIKKGTKQLRKKPVANKGVARKRKHQGERDELDIDWSISSPDDELELDIECDDGGSSKALRTPSKKRQKKKVSTPSKRWIPGGMNILQTPTQKVTVKKPLLFTPLSTRHLSPAMHMSTPYALARHRLHVSTLPTTLPCREAEFSEVYSHLCAAITEGTGSCIYISGTPGTGKTATVREVVTQLQGLVSIDELDDFTFVEINGMKVTDPHQSYSLLWEAIKNERVSPQQALRLLEREFSTPSPRRVPCVVLMDELDQLVTRGQGVMYNFFNWPGGQHSRLIVLAVANTMDLPERTLSNKISSRLGLTRITFPGYTHSQLQKIVTSRLEGVTGNIVDPDAIQFASRKVAAVSGDARRALDICRRAVEIVEYCDDNSDIQTTPSRRNRSVNNNSSDKMSGGRVTIQIIKRAIAESTSSPLQTFLKLLPLASKIFLAALLARMRRSGVAENLLADVFEEAERMTALADESTHGIISGGARRAGMGMVVIGLLDSGVIGVEGRRGELGGRVRVLIGEEEVKSALRGDKDVGSMIGT